MLLWQLVVQLLLEILSEVFLHSLVELVLNHLDFGNSLYVGLPANQIRRLQSVQNAAARIVSGLRRSEHITDALVCLHYLRVPERIAFKVAVQTYRALHGQGSYLSVYSVYPVSLLDGRLLPPSCCSSDAPIDRRAQGVSCFWHCCVEPLIVPALPSSRTHTKEASTCIKHLIY